MTNYYDHALRIACFYFKTYCHEISKQHGFWNGIENDNIPTKIALIHSEVSELLEANRKRILQSEHIPHFSGEEEEFADIMIRLFDLAERMNIRLGEAIIAKCEYNKTREYRHGGKAY